MQYGYRFDMQPNPAPQIYRFDPRHVLLDPYARALSNGSAWGTYPPGQRPYRNNLIVENNFDWEHDQPLNIPLVDSVIYEMHVRSFTEHCVVRSRAPRHVRRTGREDSLSEESWESPPSNYCRSTSSKSLTLIG